MVYAEDSKTETAADARMMKVVRQMLRVRAVTRVRRIWYSGEVKSVS